MKLLLWTFAFLVLLTAAFFAVVLYNTWREKNKQAQMARENAWRIWIGQVRDRLESIGIFAAIDREAEV